MIELFAGWLVQPKMESNKDRKRRKKDIARSQREPAQIFRWSAHQKVWKQLRGLKILDSYFYRIQQRRGWRDIWAEWFIFVFAYALINTYACMLVRMDRWTDRKLDMKSRSTCEIETSDWDWDWDWKIVVDRTLGGMKQISTERLATVGGGNVLCVSPIHEEVNATWSTRFTSRSYVPKPPTLSGRIQIQRNACVRACSFLACSLARSRWLCSCEIESKIVRDEERDK